MQKEFIPYEQALALKELGFEEPCFSIYILALIENGKALRLDNVENHNVWDDKISAPTFSQAFRWFREHYLLFSSISADQTMEPKFCYSISRYESTQFFEGWENIVYNSDLYYIYEEAELACLKKLIEILKNQ